MPLPEIICCLKLIQEINSIQEPALVNPRDTTMGKCSINFKAYAREMEYHKKGVYDNLHFDSIIIIERTQG